MAKTRAQQNRALRQEALREMLSKKCTVEQVLKNVKKMEQPGVESAELAALKAATDCRLKLITKYLPDLKSTELTGKDGEELKIQLINYANNNDPK